METIKAIRQISTVRAPESENDWSTFDGYEIETTEQTIRLLMDMSGQCCEKFGYFLSEDNLESFVGAELRDVKLTDAELKTDSIKKDIGYEYGESPEVMFVNLETDRGVLQFVAYNAHNGYYSHSARVESRQLTKDERL